MKAIRRNSSKDDVQRQGCQWVVVVVVVAGWWMQGGYSTSVVGWRSVCCGCFCFLWIFTFALLYLMERGGYCNTNSSKHRSNLNSGHSTYLTWPFLEENKNKSVIESTLGNSYADCRGGITQDGEGDTKWKGWWGAWLSLFLASSGVVSRPVQLSPAAVRVRVDMGYTRRTVYNSL